MYYDLLHYIVLFMTGGLFAQISPVPFRVWRKNMENQTEIPKTDLLSSYEERIRCCRRVYCSITVTQRKRP